MIFDFENSYASEKSNLNYNGFGSKKKYDRVLERVEDSIIPVNVYDEKEELEDFELARQFGEIFANKYNDSVKRNAGGFELEMINTETNETFFKATIEGDAYKSLKEPDKYVEIVAYLSAIFVISFKSSYKLN